METYPHECCGALLGRDGDAGREVIDLLPLANRRDDSPRNRFEVTPDDVRLAEKTAREKQIELIGWYHSHPDAPARPSEFDRDHAWPWYSYIIVSVQKGEPRDTTSWRLQDDRAAYDPETIETVGAVGERLSTLRRGQARFETERFSQGGIEMPVKVMIPTPLRAYAGKQESVQLQAATVGEALVGAHQPVRAS